VQGVDGDYLVGFPGNRDCFPDDVSLDWHACCHNRYGRGEGNKLCWAGDPPDTGSDYKHYTYDKCCVYRDAPLSENIKTPEQLHLSLECGANSKGVQHFFESAHRESSVSDKIWEHSYHVMYGIYL